MRSTKDQLVKKDVLMPVKHNVFLWNLPDVEEVPPHDGETILLWSPWKYRCGQRTVRMAVMACSQNQAVFTRRRSELKLKLELVEEKQKLLDIRERKKENARVPKYVFLKKQLRSKFTSGKTKFRLYKTLILPVLLYASETWTLNLETIRALETFKIKALRTIFEPVKDQGCWRTRYNFELYRLYKEPQVTQVIRSNRLRWLGNIWRSPENNQTRAYTFKNPMASRTRGFDLIYY
ncbi:uncharacterized protein TNCV_1001431 [Trichonephila clavipes]|nr:uncharacterized protein TNCV_1001431 [Trichonephila clavipes]